MQTFLPFPDFQESARVLDYKRLGKQRVEADQLLYFLFGMSPSWVPTSAWANHPCTRMWKGFENALLLYRNTMIEEWERQGYRNIKLQYLDSISLPNSKIISVKKKIIYPPWLGDERFHQSHRQTLLAKNTEWYSQFGWKETPLYEYYWPHEDYGL